MPDLKGYRGARGARGVGVMALAGSGDGLPNPPTPLLQQGASNRRPRSNLRHSILSSCFESLSHGFTKGVEVVQ